METSYSVRVVNLHGQFKGVTDEACPHAHESAEDAFRCQWNPARSTSQALEVRHADGTPLSDLELRKAGV